MRILAVSNCPALEHLGSGYIITNYVNGLRALGHEIDLLQPDDYEICQMMRPRANSYRQAMGMLASVTRSLRFKRYDLVEFWGGEAWLVALWLTRLPGNRPLVVQHTNGPEPRYNRLLQDAGILRMTPLKSWHVESLVTYAFSCPDAIVTVSEYDKTWLEKMRFPKSRKILSIENPLPACFIGRPIKKRDTSLIGFCGSWLPKKGISVIVRDITRVLREFPDWNFLVLGAGSENNVASYFAQDVRGRVEVSRMINSKETLATQYERVDIFILPSIIESFGIALAEAMACGCAVVTTRVGLGSSLIDGTQAILLKEPKSPFLYESVKQLILDPQKRKDLASAAWERAQSLRWDEAITTLSATYEQWLAEYRQSIA
jgi:glycosyltransferase involved in cell wall biosynthesis